MAAGYSFLRITEGDGLNMPAGWWFSLAGHTGSWASIVGEVAGNYKSESGDTLKLHTFMGGARVNSTRSGAVIVFGQFLVGGMNFSNGDSETHLAIEPGAGIDVPLGDRIAVRAQVGFPMAFMSIFDNRETFNTVRVSGGLSFQLGGR
jgi:hypothetical protein